MAARVTAAPGRIGRIRDSGMQKLIQRLQHYLNTPKVVFIGDAWLDYRDVLVSFPPDIWTIPVLIVAYYPVRDGCVDIRITGDIGEPLPVVKRHVQLTTNHVIHALQVGSIYHGYKNPDAQPSLRYEIIEWLEFEEPLPTKANPNDKLPLTDYYQIMERIDIRYWVEERGIKEVWIWGYHGDVLVLWESNMSGPYGDISNSSRDLHDLPVLSKTYTVYHYNYQRGASEAVEDHMHQIEAVLRYADPVLFWEKFVGKPGEGRCGWSHYPPNGVRDYDWRNPDYVLSDIEDWTPDGTGEKKLINCDRWHGHSLTWFIYWMQNIPGRDNGLTYQNRALKNWWRLIGDFDGAMSEPPPL
jgi:hypothetical protein